VLPANFLSDRSPLRGDDAVAALITVEDGRYLMQLRDDIPHIFYPGHWGCFGGAVGLGEAPADALARELGEELEMAMPAAAEFVRLDFDLTKLGQKRIFRIYYEVLLTEAEVSRLTLHEGADMHLFSAPELLALPHVTPYDSFAVWLHTARKRLNQSV
jgi:8-oxo-dGTP pyrophosphatase MutT (NUDIX family)